MALRRRGDQRREPVRGASLALPLRPGPGRPVPGIEQGHPDVAQALEAQGEGAEEARQGGVLQRLQGFGDQGLDHRQRGRGLDLGRAARLVDDDRAGDRRRHQVDEDDHHHQPRPHRPAGPEGGHQPASRGNADRHRTVRIGPVGLGERRCGGGARKQRALGGAGKPRDTSLGAGSLSMRRTRVRRNCSAQFRLTRLGLCPAPGRRCGERFGSRGGRRSVRLKQTCVGRPTPRSLRFLFCRRFLPPNRYPLRRNLLGRRLTRSSARRHRPTAAAPGWWCGGRSGRSGRRSRCCAPGRCRNWRSGC